MDVPSQALEAAATAIARALCDQEERAEAEGETAWYGLGTDFIAELAASASLAAVESVLRTQIAAEINQMQADPHATALQRLGYLTGVADAANLVAAPVHPLPQKGSNT